MGILLSLLLHLGLMQLFRPHAAADAAPGSQPAMTWLLLPAAPPAPARAAPITKPPVVQHDPHPAQPSVRTNTITPLPSAIPRENSIGDTAAITQPAHKQPRVDLDAAFNTARKIATDPAERRNGTAVSQLQTHPLEARPDNPLAQDIQRSARADCLDVGRPFGLLAPLVLAADAVLSKKDSGCKW
ncbi:hypothetical protein V8G57_17485 [Collimonas sp. H4R21]|uniref:Uncharacterized protein n=1 Tax=Collimonas rhizosphaerae TaxID=3126357 RepID=A0ABU9PYU4_9BURK